MFKRRKVNRLDRVNPGMVGRGAWIIAVSMELILSGLIMLNHTWTTRSNVAVLELRTLLCNI